MKWHCEARGIYILDGIALNSIWANIPFQQENELYMAHMGKSVDITKGNLKENRTAGSGW